VVAALLVLACLDPFRKLEAASVEDLVLSECSNPVALEAASLLELLSLQELM